MMTFNTHNILAAGLADNPALIVGIVVALVVVLILIVRAVSKDEESKPTIKADRPTDGAKPTSVMDDRLEVEGPVTISDDMSLAEIKRAKSAKIKKKDRRETAVEATAKAKKDHTELAELEMESVEKDGEDPEEPESFEDISTAWDDMLDDMEPKTADAEESTPDEAQLQDSAEDAAEVQSVDQGEEPAEDPDGNDKAEVSVAKSATPEKSLQEGLAKTRNGFIQRLGDIFSKDTLDEDLVEEVEEVLYTADIGNKAAGDILQKIEERLDGDEKRDPAAVWSFVREYVESVLDSRESHLDIEVDNPFVIMVVGVNGVGKTTTIGKLASRYAKQGKNVMMVAGDTFRAAAVEQLAVWGERTGIPVHQGESEADPASVIYAGIEHGVAEGVDVIICDTAGRLHTKVNLLDELRKMGRVASKVIDTAPHETILVLDANTGQNAIQQAKMFSAAVDITGIVLTKLDGTAKGGVILGICEELDAPIRFIGIGEGVADLREFNAAEFVEALFM